MKPTSASTPPSLSRRNRFFSARFVSSSVRRCSFLAGTAILTSGWSRDPRIPFGSSAASTASEMFLASSRSSFVRRSDSSLRKSWKICFSWDGTYCSRLVSTDPTSAGMETVCSWPSPPSACETNRNECPSCCRELPCPALSARTQLRLLLRGIALAPVLKWWSNSRTRAVRSRAIPPSSARNALSCCASCKYCLCGARSRYRLRPNQIGARNIPKTSFSDGG